MSEIMSEPKRVHVCAYTRQRLGRLEQVCEHWRSWPKQLTFGFWAGWQPGIRQWRM